eukprot:scaffold5114_cov67-Cylindrotheca_fusiformis.AAC.8
MYRMLKKIAKYLRCKKATMQQNEEVEDEAWIYSRRGIMVPPTVRRVKIAKGIRKIPEAAFQGHRELEEVILSSSVQVIGKEAFWHCMKLKSILYQGKGKEEVGIPSNVKVIEKRAFLQCGLLKNLVLNEGLERIGRSAFQYCGCLTAVGIPSTVKVIDQNAFRQCTSLARLVLKEGRLERIGNEAFYGCDSLSHVRIPRSVNTLAADAFVKCSRLISIELPGECSFNIDLTECLSLVSVVGPVSITKLWWLVDIREKFFRVSKLGSLVDNKTDLRRRLKHRFDNSPMNKLCYYQSYHSSEDAMLQLRSLMEDDPWAAATQVDQFGMTPLHILSLSQTPNMDMLLAVMKGGLVNHIMCGRDWFGSTPMDYLCLNRMPNSSEVIRRVLQTRFDQLLGMDRTWKSSILQAIDGALAVDWSSRSSEIYAIYMKLANYERQEMISFLLELRLWKIKIDDGNTNAQTADREFCRIHSGASIVIPNVLSFLDKLQPGDHCFSLRGRASPLDP